MAASAHAQTYKWVDQNGVTNYSSTPPAGKLSNKQVVPDRISVATVDASLASAIAAYRAQTARQTDWAEIEWLQRQRLMAAAQTPPPSPACPYRTDCDGYPWHTHSVVFVPAVQRRSLAVVRNTGFAHRGPAVRATRTASR